VTPLENDPNARGTPQTNSERTLYAALLVEARRFLDTAALAAGNGSGTQVGGDQDRDLPTPVPSKRLLELVVAREESGQQVRREPRRPDLVERRRGQAGDANSDAHPAGRERAIVNPVDTQQSLRRSRTRRASTSRSSRWTSHRRRQGYMIVRADNILYGKAACEYIGAARQGLG